MFLIPNRSIHRSNKLLKEEEVLLTLLLVDSTFPPSVSMCEGFRRSIEICVRRWLFTLILKVFEFRSMAANGPSYGAVSDGRILSFLMNSCEQDAKYGWTNGFALLWWAVWTCLISFIRCLCSATNSDGGMDLLSQKNSFGRRSGEPWTNSAAVAPISGLKAHLSPSSTIGSLVAHFVGSLSDINADFNVLWKRSINPLAWGWYGDVLMCWVPSVWLSSWNSVLSNCRPWSVDTRSGTPKRDIHDDINAFATVFAVISAIGIASGQRVYLSMIVKQYRLSAQVSSGPLR